MPERRWQKSFFFFFLTHFEDTYHPDADCTSDSLHLRECKRWFVFKKSDYLRISHKAAISVPTMFLRVGHKQFVQGVREANQWCLGDQSSVLLFAMHDKVLLFKLSAMKHKFGINFGDTVICPAGTICPSSSAANSRCLFGLGRVLSFISFRFKYYSGFLVLQNKSTVQPKNWITAHTGMKSEAQILSCYSFLYWFVHYLWSFTTVYNKYSLVLRCAVLCIVLYLEMVDFTRMQLSVTVQTQNWVQIHMEGELKYRFGFVPSYPWETIYPWCHDTSKTWPSLSNATLNTTQLLIS